LPYYRSVLTLACVLHKPVTAEALVKAIDDCLRDM
jgi:hypothetical protein